MSDLPISSKQAEQILIGAGLATGALAALAPGAFHRVYGTGEVDGKTLSMTRYFGNALMSANVIAMLAGDDERSAVLKASVAFNTTSALLSFAAQDISVTTRVKAGLTSLGFAALAYVASQD